MRRAFALLIGVVLLAACATGVLETGPMPDDGLGGGEDTGGGGEETSQGTGATSEGGMGGMGEGGMGEGAMGAMGGGGMGGGMMCDYTHLNSCPGAQTMPSIAGDENGPTQTQTGDTSKWFQIQITEEDSGIFDEDLSYTVTLQSPPGMDYQVFVHLGPQDGNPNCNATPIVGQPQGNADVVHQSWDDDQPLGGEDDSAWLSIEVVHVSGGLCGPGNEWLLSVTGNT